MSQPLTPEAIAQALASLPDWTYADQRLTKTFRFHHFKEALSFIVRVGLEAETVNHHPELFNVYNTVKISLNTHDAGGRVTQKDVDLARAIEHFNWAK